MGRPPDFPINPSVPVYRLFGASVSGGRSTPSRQSQCGTGACWRREYSYYLLLSAVVEHLASGCFCLFNASPFYGYRHASRNAGYGLSSMDVYHHRRTHARAQYHPDKGTPCRMVKRIKGGAAMNWSSPAEFFAMGGYGVYVWGSLIVTIAAVCLEYA